MATIFKNELTMYEVQDENKKNFVPLAYNELSDFNAFCLRKIGDTLRPSGSQFFWCNGAFCWWVRRYDKDRNPVHDSEFCVWMTKNGCLMFEDNDNNKIFRVWCK